jgi:hypothetical protein
MSVRTYANTQQSPIDLRRIWLAGLVAVVASVAANLIVRALLFAVLDLPGDFPPFQVGAIAMLTTLGVVAATIVFAIVARFARNPVKTYAIIAAVALVLSILPNLASMANPDAIPFPFPGASPLAFGVLIIFHIVAAVVAVAVLLGMTRRGAEAR